MTEKQESSKPRLFEDNEGNPSSMRMMSFIALLASIGFGFITIFHKSANIENGLYITIVFLLAAFAPKAVQKFAEARFPHRDSKGKISK